MNQTATVISVIKIQSLQQSIKVKCDITKTFYILLGNNKI